MSIEVVMPRTGETVEEGTLAEVRVGEGETVPVATVLALIAPNGAT
jgi:pyruvate/2-oxoglutarate dehydrogenase complex dihydrolipoamide acyltransferase (E2) component